MFGRSVRLVCIVGVSLSDRVLFPSISIGLLDVLYIFMVLLFIAARVGGGASY